MSVTHLNNGNFEEIVLNGNKPVLVDFWADWCMPCKMFAPILDEAAAEFGEKVIVGKVNIDEEESLATQYGVMSIPTVIAFKNGKEINRSVGAVSKAELLKMIK